MIWYRSTLLTDKKDVFIIDIHDEMRLKLSLTREYMKYVSQNKLIDIEWGRSTL